MVELALTFLRLGVISFGGPAAHIALMEDEFVRRRQWLSRDEFLDMLGVTNMIPGPNSTEMAIHIGYRRAGFAGLLVAGISFILPSVLLVTFLAWAYVRFGNLAIIQGVLYGIKPVIIAIILQALWGLGRAAVKSSLLGSVAVAAILLAFAGVHELLILFGGAAFAAIIGRVLETGSSGRAVPPSLIPAVLLINGPRGIAAAATAVAGAAATTAKIPAGLAAIFVIFLKIGSVLFGSGYVLLAFLRSDLVERFGWITEAQLLDATAIGQVTPGPLFSTATVIGYMVQGIPGAIVATIGIFLPAFVFVAISAPFIPMLRKSRWAARLLDGVNVTALALMAVVTWQLAREAIVDVATTAAALATVVLLIQFRVNTLWLIAGGVGLGFLSYTFS